MIVGGAGVTWTVLVTLPPFRDTVMRVLPGLTAVTGTNTASWPEENATEAGTVATLDAELLVVKLPGAVGVGARVAVKVPVAPTVIVSGSGDSVVGTGLGTPIVAPSFDTRLVASK